ncbi:uncharacterized protein N7518_000537 [Penicillium psychrosexuale]|uniref:uncharacterized protein n=1 Tax=Penicillium psychrosexuale TaxID=1002107 RepID=UPI00254522BC|nr:uncharacterized protein N7518_000537 [Penicillium psychrosexuale]KAJ5804234.1 hypothetical protein N7518_000537 [Penicillium psychrosexuale]
MDKQTQTRRCDEVKRLYKLLKSCESWFLSPGDLQGLGIYSQQVGMTGDGSVQFDPCFFRPYPEKVLQKYPLDTVSMAADHPPQTLQRLNNPRDFQTLLREVQNDPKVEHPLEFAKSRWDTLTLLYGPDAWEDHARQTRWHIQSQQMLPRRGLSRDSTLSDLRSIYERRTKWKHSAPELCGLNRRNYWRILSLREVFQPSFNPHAIMELLSDVPANDAENCLTLQEVSAVLTVMVARTSDRPFRDHPIHPLLVLSYTGQKHGRIIQASLHGESLLLQYSQLWSFADDETAPVELFTLPQSILPTRIFTPPSQNIICEGTKPN